MPNLETILKYNPEKHADAIPLYYKEYQKGGSFKEQVLNAKTQDTEKDYALLCAWYQKVFDQMAGELNEAENDKEALATQTKMLAYNCIFQEQTHEIYKEDYRRKNPGKGDPNRFSAPKEIREWNTKTRSTFKVNDMGINSFGKNVDKTIAERYDEIRAKKADDKKREEIQKSAKREEKDYLVDINDKYTELQQKYNDAMKIETETTDADWTRAYKKADAIQKETKSFTIMEMIRDVEEQLIAPQIEKLAKIEQETVAPARMNMEEIMFAMDGRVDHQKYAEGLANFDILMKRGKEDAKKPCTDLKQTQMSLYVATKRRMDSRGMLSKLFHPTRTKQENAMFAKMRNELKETLGADDRYMDKVDSCIAKKDKYFTELPNVEGHQQLSKVNYTGAITKQAEAFGKRHLRAELDKAFGVNNEKKDMTVSQPAQNKQLQQTGPKVE